MRFTQIAAALVCTSFAHASPAKNANPNACKNNNLIRCFLASSALAAPYCSSYIGNIEPTSTAVVQKTVVFTTFFTNTIWTVQTETSTDFFTTTTTLPAPIFAANNAATKKPPKPTPTTLKCLNGQAAASVSHACSCFESSVGSPQPTTKTSTTTTTTPVTTSETDTSTTVTTVESAAATSVVPYPGPICNQSADFFDTDPNNILGNFEGYDSNACALACAAQTGCISYAIFEYFGFCGLFSVLVSEIAVGTGMYTFWDAACPVPASNVPSCDAPGNLPASSQVPITTYDGVTDQSGCQAYCSSNSGCLSYSLQGGNCVNYAAFVSQWEDTTADNLIAWDITCPISSYPCGFMANAIGGGVVTAGPFAEYCYQLCLSDDPCVAYAFDSVNLQCVFFNQTVATIAPPANPSGIAYYDISCAPPAYPTPACGVYATTNAATDTNFIFDLTGISTIDDCLNNCLYGCQSVAFFIDSNGVANCQQYQANLAAMLPPPDPTQTTIWYDSTCPLPPLNTP